MRFLLSDVLRCLHSGYGRTAREVAMMSGHSRLAVAIALWILIKIGKATQGADLTIQKTRDAFIYRDIEVYRRSEND
jgi:hypothetical protein